MGIDLNSAQLLIEAHKNGVSFERIAMLGRQELHGYRPALISILKKAGYQMSKALVCRLLDPKTIYCEDFLRLLGAKEIVAIDASDYEGAQIVHDMNCPIPVNLVSSFDLVLDCGTLEHIFDFPMALRNSVRMVRPQGRFISVTMANNFCGHGFYQFSPELFYRFLSPKNGYTVESLIMWEDVLGARFYRIPDPDSVQSRIELTSEFGTYMVVQARRLGDVLRKFIPQQSDYVRLWEGPADPSEIPAKPKSAFRRNGVVSFAILVLRKLIRLRNNIIWAKRYRRQRIKRNSRGLLTPLKDLRVIR